jgi:hypothetical protein
MGHHPSTVFAEGDQRVTGRRTRGRRPHAAAILAAVSKRYVTLTEEIHDRAGVDATGLELSRSA